MNERNVDEIEAEIYEAMNDMGCHIENHIEGNTDSIQVLERGAIRMRERITYLENKANRHSWYDIMIMTCVLLLATQV